MCFSRLISILTTMANTSPHIQQYEHETRNEANDLFSDFLISSFIYPVIFTSWSYFKCFSNECCNEDQLYSKTGCKRVHK